MKTLLELICRDLSDTPPLVANAFRRMLAEHSEPAIPRMTQEEFDALPYFDKCILTCNFIGCDKVVCTHGLLCVEHKNEMKNSSVR